MLKVLVVDDETLILEGLAEGVNWDKLKCHRPILARNGLLLKPTKLDELEESIKKAAKSIDEQNRLDILFNKSKAIIEQSNRQALIDSLIFDRISDPNRIKNALEDTCKSKYLHKIVIIQIYNYSKDLINKKDYIVQYIKYIEELLKTTEFDKSIDVLVQYEKDKILLYFSTNCSHISYEYFSQTVENLIHDLRLHLKEITPFDTAFGCSRTDRKIENLKNMYLEALEQCDAEKQNMLPVEDTDKEGLMKLLNPNFKEHIQNTDSQALMRDIDDVFQKCLDKTLSYAKGIAIELINYAIFCCGRDLLTGHIDMQKAYENIINSKDVNDTFRIVKDFIKNLCMFLNSEGISDGGVLIDRIAAYIKRNFFNDLSLESVAERFYISPGHLSRLFRKYYKTTFLNFLTKVRIENAKILLQNPRYKVYEVCTMVGFDRADGMIELDMGLISRAGWSLVDDTKSLVFSEEYMLVSRETIDNSMYRDLYFFGYGHDYKKCMRDYFQVAGNVPLIPRWALGNWWSRYWEYSQAELKELMLEFREKKVPLSVCVIDMDWHIVRDLPYSGWTGYTWNRELFPDPEQLIEWLHNQGLKTSLNLHPADGVRPHEEAYEEMARFMGLDPSAKKSVEFDITDPKFIEAYFEILHHPLEEQGIDFWWMDWQQGTETKVKGLDPLWFLNHLHFFDLGRTENKRPFVFSRWGGLGNHRYPIGFSGDTIVSWESLAFQPYFTLTAANVGYGWWSHDIGGHMGGVEDRELYTRWVQFGVFSPVFRLHSNKNPFHRRLPWQYDEEVFNITRDAMQFRHMLIPYLYTMAWKYSNEGLPVVMPMYYNHPDEDIAYQCTKQYYFGSEMIVSPFVSPTDKDTGLARQVVWLPEGDWFDFCTGEYNEGGFRRAVYGTLRDIPVFAKAGAIIPLGERSEWGGVNNPEKMTIIIFPGRDNKFCLYEDDGSTQLYKHGHYCNTEFALKWLGNSLVFDINPATGDTGLIPGQREYDLVFKSIKKPDCIRVTINGEEQITSFSYNDKKSVLELTGLKIRPEDQLSVYMSTEQNTLMEKIDLTKEKFEKALMSFNINTYVKRRIFRDLDEVIKNIGILGRGFINNKRYKIPTIDDDLKPVHVTALCEILKKQDIISLLSSEK